MGMIGNYIALDDIQIKQIADGEIELEQLDLTANETLDIDKSWQAIHYLLCGDICEGAPPLGYVVPMLDENMVDFAEYGAFYLFCAQVEEAFHAVAKLSERDVVNLYRFEAMLEDGVYPIVSDEDGESFFEYLLANLRAIQSFYEKVAAKKQGVIFYIL
ncbi:YfbM family protein [Paenibacillus eucommiae]|uniref:DUF1877 family protein n=1 Tax=Paenibacillus eucommiae TaxID=1355755 RepID=A0ABS4J9R6_9BACL|nr:YfbM family protein [Paenibacillus eucommiae]MBP1996540.1 hypothetical protein [Paenibacillus eucommiae]